MKREAIKFTNNENYYPLSVHRQAGGTWINHEVARFYEGSYGGNINAEVASEGLKKQADSAGGVGGGSLGNSIMTTVPQMYLPEFASPDRLFFPTEKKQAMKYWRYFYSLDPVCGNVIDMYSDMLLSDVELAGVDDKDMLDTYYASLEDTQALNLFKWMVVGYMVDGEVLPHLVWDEEESYWSYLGFQDPINVNVIDVPFIGEEPYAELHIPDAVRKILLDPNPRYERFRKGVPTEMLDAVMQNRGIPLNTEENVTFIPRKLTPYDVRGISVFSRIWRVLMYEDAVFNATIQTARRHAAPVKVVKLGNPATGWIPGPEHAEKLKQLLAAVETDPQAWLLYHYGISFEAWGTTDRVMTIGKEWDTIERIKLIALGVSKAFLTGEVTYASAEKGMQIFLARLQAMRTFFETKWWYPRFFGVMARKNEWVRPTAAEVSHRVKTRRAKRELVADRRYMVPRMVWQKSLDPQSKQDLVRLYGEVKDRLGLKISRSEVAANLGLDWEEEEIKSRQEDKRLVELDKEYGPAQPEAQEGGAGGMGGGAMGGPAAPPAGEEAAPEELGGPVAPPPGEEAPAPEGT